MNELQKIAYQLAEWVVSRQYPVERLATVMVWAESNGIDLDHGAAEYVLDHWHDYVMINS